MAYELSENFLNVFTFYESISSLNLLPSVWKRPVHMAQMFTEAYENRQMKEKSRYSYAFEQLSK